MKYRGFFLNDEQPVLWNWAKDHFKMGDRPPFQVEMYEKVFELLLRLKGNYLWPASGCNSQDRLTSVWASMFAVDGLDTESGYNETQPGPNQILADKMGVIMGTSHHEPMSRNQKEFDRFGRGDWNFTSNAEYLKQFWEDGATRAKGFDTLYTIGMRGNGDLPLDGANIEVGISLTAVTDSRSSNVGYVMTQELTIAITAAQQEILRNVLGDMNDVPQMWAMYKEVMGYFANGVSRAQCLS